MEANNQKTETVIMENLIKLLKKNAGFALTEIMVATAILTVILLSITSVFLNGQKSYFYVEGSTKNLQEARYSAEQLSRDLRSAISITSASSNSITFIGDYDGDNSSETINYTKSLSSLTRTIGSSYKEVATGITNSESESKSQPVFSYYDQDGTEVTDLINNLDDIKLVVIDLWIDLDTSKSPTRSTQITTSIQLRNLHERS